MKVGTKRTARSKYTFFINEGFLYFDPMRFPNYYDDQVWIEGSQGLSTLLLILGSLKWVVSVPSSLLFPLQFYFLSFSNHPHLSSILYMFLVVSKPYLSVFFIQDQCFSCNY